MCTGRDIVPIRDIEYSKPFRGLDVATCNQTISHMYSTRRSVGSRSEVIKFLFTVVVYIFYELTATFFYPSSHHSYYYNPNKN